MRYQVVHTVVSFVEAEDPDAAEQAVRIAINARADSVVVLEDAEIVEDGTAPPADGPVEP